MQDTITKPLLKWYGENKRVLPWREKKNPYEIWVSEIMLQQTRVEAVKPFYERFMRELPNVAALAVCPEEKLLKLWEGLGYYNRVRNMQKAAQKIMEVYDGVFPADYEALKGLPGIGNYTAGAVASIAFCIPVPAVDGNVLRVMARLREDGEDILKQSVKNRVEAELTEIMPAEDPGAFNQAMMDLGAMVCLPNGAPKCEVCPLFDQCLAGQHQTWTEYPFKKSAKPRRIEDRTVLLFLDGTHTAVRKRPKKGLLAGLYEFPNFDGVLSEQEALEEAEKFGVTPLHIQALPPYKHIFSHVEWHITGYAVHPFYDNRVSKLFCGFLCLLCASYPHPVCRGNAALPECVFHLCLIGQNFRRLIRNAGQMHLFTDIADCADGHIGSRCTDSVDLFFFRRRKNRFFIPRIQFINFICKCKPRIIAGNTHYDRVKTHSACSPDQRHLVNTGT